MSKRIADIFGTASYLKLSPHTLRKKANKGEIPAKKLKGGRRWLFDLDRIDAWFEGLESNDKKIA